MKRHTLISKYRLNHQKWRIVFFLLCFHSISESNSIQLVINSFEKFDIWWKKNCNAYGLHLRTLFHVIEKLGCSKPGERDREKEYYCRAAYADKPTIVYNYNAPAIALYSACAMSKYVTANCILNSWEWAMYCNNATCFLDFPWKFHNIYSMIL